jgi:hypothetical protein
MRQIPNFKRESRLAGNLRRRIIPWVLVGLLVPAGRAACSEDLTAALGEPYYTGRIIPTPQKCRLLSTELPLADAASRKPLAAILRTSDLPAVRFGVESFAGRIARAAELSEFPVVEWDAVRLPEGFDGYIIVGVAGDRALTKTPGYDPAWADSEREDEYHIRPTRLAGKPAILVVGRDPRGAYYGLAGLNQLTRAQGTRIVLRTCEIDDRPEFSMRSLSHPQPGEGLVPFIHWMAGYKLNQLTINYYENWQNTRPYYYQAMEALGNEAKRTGIFDLGQIVNPYDPRYHPTRYKIRVSKEEDVQRLLEQFRISLNQGCRFIMLAADDHVDVVNGEYALTDAGDRLRFFDVADAHVFLVNRVYETLKAEYPGVKMAFCPPYYSNAAEKFVRSPAMMARYLRKLGLGLNPEVGIVWTGPKVTSLAFTDADMDYYQGMVGRKTMIWDNTAIRASTQRFLHFTGDEFPRDLAERSSFRGFYVNMRSLELFKPFCVTVADYLWNPRAYDGPRSIRTALRSVYGESAARALEAWGQVYNQALEVKSRPAAEPRKLGRLIEELAGLRDRVARGAPMYLSTFDDDVARLKAELQAMESLPTIVCPLIEQAPALDGALDPDEWRSAAEFSRFRDVLRREVKIEPTRARMLRTEDALYFGVECVQDPNVKHAPPVTNHDGSIFFSDVIEIFLDPARTRSGHFHFVVSSLGTRFDEERRGLGLGITHWNPQWDVAVKSVEGGWTAEVRIPFSILGESAPESGAVWGLNLCRGYYEGEQTTCWSPTLGRFSNHLLYGICRF